MAGQFLSLPQRYVRYLYRNFSSDKVETMEIIKAHKLTLSSKENCCKINTEQNIGAVNKHGVLV